MIGKTISHYKILEKIGEGGMGVVFKAEDIKLKRRVALKFLPQELMRDREAKERFFQEAQAAAALNHPNICTIHEIDEAEGQTFIAMEYLVGQNLKDRISSSPIRIEEALDTAIEIANGLHEAHEKGIVHRDIKPANIMLMGRGQVKIMDFGLAKLAWGVDLTKTATIMGTVAYMSPEQAKGERVDNRTDIWSFGCVVYEMFTGKRPFRTAHDQAVIHAILKTEPQKLSSLRLEIPSELDTIVEKALAKNPENRYQSAQGILDDLRSVKSEIYMQESARKTAESKPSIAVLPFVNMSADPEQEYFCDGIAEELINALSHMEGLRVIARTSSFSFKGKSEDIRAIGKQLDVQTILEGSVRKYGNKVRITAQLIDVTDGSHLWSERYDRELEDIFAIQDEISATIVANLKVKLSPADEARAEARHSSNIVAYDAYLRGVFYYNKMTEMWGNKAIASFEKAISLDPDYALAYAGLAEAHIWLSFFSDLALKDIVQKIKEYIRKALELDPTLAEGHMLKGTMAFYHDWDRMTAARELERALELNPNSAKTIARYAAYLMFYERKYEKALSLVDKAVALDPLDLHVKTYRVWLYCFLEKIDEALWQAKKILDLEPNYPYGHYWLGAVYGYRGDYERAVERLEEALRLGGRTLNNLGVLGYQYAKAGRRDEAEQLAKELEERSRKGQGAAVWLSRIYLGLGDVDKVFEWLEKAYKEHSLSLFYIPIEPVYAELRSDPRFVDLIKRMGLESLLD
ncbi:MAG: protein kinase [Candidatus Aminicenantes bacterium]|jgi:serine/threonine protein kinase/Tfp pilus assembly protein PilF